MGIQNLYSHFTASRVIVRNEDLKGKCVGVDISCFLHKAILRCTFALLSEGTSNVYVDIIIKQAEQFRKDGIDPYFVFDGLSLPLKAPTHVERQKRRMEARSKLQTGVSRNVSRLNQSSNVQSSAVEVTPEMAYKVRMALIKNGFKCLVSPYEADGQLSYGCRSGIWWAVISEDSDILAMGCPRLITKWKQGAGEMYIYEKVPKDLMAVGSLIEKGMPSDAQEGRGTILPSQFILGCVLSGCDYLKNIPGIGIRRAFKYLRDGRGDLERVYKLMRLEGFRANDEYIQGVQLALWGFYSALVFDPRDDTYKITTGRKTFVDNEECVAVSLPSNVEVIVEGHWEAVLTAPFESAKSGLGLTYLEGIPSDKWIRFSKQGDINKNTFEKFDEVSQEHPVFMTQNTKGKDTTKGAKTGMKSLRAMRTPIQTSPGKNLTDYMKKAEVPTNHKTKESPPRIELSEDLLRKHRERLPAASTPRAQANNILLYLKECYLFKEPQVSMLKDACLEGDTPDAADMVSASQRKDASLKVPDNILQGFPRLEKNPTPATLATRECEVAGATPIQSVKHLNYPQILPKKEVEASMNLELFKVDGNRRKGRQRYSIGEVSGDTGPSCQNVATTPANGGIGMIRLSTPIVSPDKRNFSQHLKYFSAIPATPQMAFSEKENNHKRYFMSPTSHGVKSKASEPFHTPLPSKLSQWVYRSPKTARGDFKPTGSPTVLVDRSKGHPKRRLITPNSPPIPR